MDKTSHAIISVVGSDRVGIIARVTNALSESKIMHEQVLNAMHRI